MCIMELNSQIIGPLHRPTANQFLPIFVKAGR